MKKAINLKSIVGTFKDTRKDISKKHDTYINEYQPRKNWATGLKKIHNHKDDINILTSLKDHASFKIIISLKNRKCCSGCPCINAEFYRFTCNLYDKILKADSRGNIIRLPLCIKEHYK